MRKLAQHNETTFLTISFKFVAEALWFIQDLLQDLSQSLNDAAFPNLFVPRFLRPFKTNVKIHKLGKAPAFACTKLSQKFRRERWHEVRKENYRQVDG